MPSAMFITLAIDVSRTLGRGIISLPRRTSQACQESDLTVLHSRYATGEKRAGVSNDNSYGYSAVKTKIISVMNTIHSDS